MATREISIGGNADKNVIITGNGNVIHIGAKNSKKDTGQATVEEPDPELSESSDTSIAFLCHAKEDSAAVRQLYDKLKQRGYMPWMDEIDLLPGQKWDYEIRQILKRADFVLICLSKKSVQKRGYLNKEIKWTLERQEEMLEKDIFLIALKLEDCELPDRLSEFQFVELYASDGFDRLIRAIEHQRNQQNPASQHQTQSLTFG